MNFSIKRAKVKLVLTLAASERKINKVKWAGIYSRTQRVQPNLREASMFEVDNACSKRSRLATLKVLPRGLRQARIVKGSQKYRGKRDLSLRSR